MIQVANLAEHQLMSPDCRMMMLLQQVVLVIWLLALILAPIATTLAT
jgi:maltodextrin utilization protein YvdJ